MNATKNTLVANIEALLADHGFQIGKTGWHDLGTLRVALDTETVNIYQFVGRVGTTLAWGVQMSLYGTPFAIIAATINAAIIDSAK